MAVLQRFEPPPFDISAAFPSNRMLAAKVRALIDFLQEECRKVCVLNAR